MRRFNLLNHFWHALSPHPLNGTDEALTNPFFIISAGRSGSTLLRAILMQHPTVCIPPESFMLGRIIRRFEREYRYLSWPHCVRLIAAEFASGVDFQFWQIKLEALIGEAENFPKEQRNLACLIQHFYLFYNRHHKPEAGRWGDKSTSNARFIDRLLKLYPRAKFIHIFRDGRDVVASRVARGWHSEVAAACDSWLELVGFAREAPVRRDSGQFLEIRYEDLVRQPEPVVRELAEFLGLTYVEAMLQPQQIVDRLGDADRLIHENLGRPISPEHIGKWRKTLTPADQEIVQQRLGPMLRTLGYGND